MRATPRSLTRRLVIGAALWTMAALVAAGLLLSMLFRDSVERSFDARLEALLENLIRVAVIDSRGAIRFEDYLVDPRFEQPYSGWYWQLNLGDGPPVRSRSLWDQELNLDVAHTDRREHRYYVRGPDDERLRIIERDITLPGSNTPRHFAIAAEASTIEQEIGKFNRALAWALGALGIGLIIAVLVQVRFGLRPLRDVQTSLADVRAGRQDRLSTDVPAEIESLVKEINALIEHNAEVLARARTHVGNLAHALKTPLSVMSNESARKGGEFGKIVAQQTETMRRHIDHYLSRARTSAAGTIISARTNVAPVAQDLVRALDHIYAERDLDIRIQQNDGEGALIFAGERQDLEEMIGNLMDNACKWARSEVRLDLTRNGRYLTVTVDDDGPGLSKAERREMFARGKRSDESKPGAGLGLSIVREVAGLSGGDVTLRDSPLGGLRAVLTLPAAG